MDAAHGEARRRRSWRRGLTLTCALAAMFWLTWLAPRAEARPDTPPCDTVWNGGSGLWADPTQWSNGVPTGGSHVCITIPGTYAVVINGAASALTLTLGGPNAAPDLVIQSVDNCAGSTDASVTLGNGGTVAPGAIIDMIHAGSCPNGVSSLTVGGGTLVNSGNIASDPGTSSSPRYIDGNITNQHGMVNINTATTYGEFQAGTFDNRGKLIVNGSELQAGPPGGFPTMVTNDTGGSISNLKTSGLLLVGGPGAPSDTFTQGGGTISPSTSAPSDPAVLLYEAKMVELRISYGTVALQSQDTLTGSPNKGQNLLLEATDFCSGPVDAVVNATSSFTNGGTFTMTHNGPCTGGQVAINVPGVLTNPGTISAVAGTAGLSGRSITATLTSTGTVSVGKGVTLVVNGPLGNYDAPTATLTGGTWNLAGPLQVTDPAFTTGIVNDDADIFLSGNGTFRDQQWADALRPIDVVGHGATFAPDLFSTISSLTNDGRLAIPAGRTLTVNGGYTQGSSGVLQIALSSPNKYGSLTSTGPASLDGGLDLNASPGFSGGTGTTMSLVTANGGLSGNFTQVTGGGLGRNGDYSTYMIDARHFWDVIDTAAVMSSSNSGPPISPFTLTGAGFEPNETIAVTFSSKSTQIGLSPAIANGSGDFTQGETVPGVPPGNYSITAVGQTSGATRILPFTVL